MDIFGFINSKDIRKHLEEIGYEFNSLEAAWLIYQCNNITLEERHKAWNELIETMPDCEIKERFNTVAQESLHIFLKKYMELDDKYLNRFYDEKQEVAYDSNPQYVYKFEYFENNGAKNDWDTVFSTFDAVYETIMEPDKEVVSIKCTKMRIDRLNSWQIAYLNPSLDVLRLYPGRIENDEELDIYWGVFEGLYFEFPTPFKKGDIVWKPKTFYLGTPCSEPFVLLGVCNAGLNDRIAQHHRENGDTTDMNAWGYFQDENGGIFSECMSNYMDIEYYNEELTGAKRTLIPISNYLKDKIDLALCVGAYHQILSKGYADDSMPCNYSKDGLALAGLVETKTDKTDGI